MPWSKKILEVTILAPWSIPGYSAPRPSTDVALARNGIGQFIIPGTLLKGNLRDAMDCLVEEKITTAEIRDHLFGVASGAGKLSDEPNNWVVDNEPNRGTLMLPDLVCEAETPLKNSRIPRVEIDQDLGAAKEGQLAFIEAPFPYLTPVKFSGEAILWNEAPKGSDEWKPEHVWAMIETALSRIFALGGMKSVGFGSVHSTDVKTANRTQPSTKRVKDGLVSVKYILDRPFLIDAKRASGNLATSSDVLPGGAIKAVIARALSALGETGLDEFVSKMRVSHANPAGRQPLPLSLSVSDGQLHCNLLANQTRGFQTFAGDWKYEDETIRKSLGEGWEAVKTRQIGRSRTEISTSTLSAAFDEEALGGEGAGSLFAQMLTDNFWPNQKDCVEFHGELASNDLENLNKVLSLLKEGIPGFGKTGATIRVVEATPAKQVPQYDRNKLAFCLTSPGCLFHPERAVGANLTSLYKEYFNSIGFEMTTFFAQQTARGRYQALRYPASTGKYLPWILTDVGSVFLLSAQSDEIVKDVLMNGLPAPEGVKTSWKDYPFCRENGFGKVVNNIVDHEALGQVGVKL